VLKGLKSGLGIIQNGPWPQPQCVVYNTPPNTKYVHHLFQDGHRKSAQFQAPCFSHHILEISLFCQNFGVKSKIFNFGVEGKKSVNINSSIILDFG
jgi:hypothetical protein